MDFLDPKAKQTRNIRLMIGYVLVFLLIVTGSLILVFSAYGFDVDRKTGQVIQNGLLYVDSAPNGANIYINGELKKDKTSAKFSLPEGQYSLEITKDGYQRWSRSFVLKGGRVERATYPMLIPDNLQSTQAYNYGVAVPSLSTQSPDRRWLMVSTDAKYLTFDQYDLNNFDKTTNRPSRTVVNFPQDIFTTTSGNRSVEVVDWSRDNQNFLVKHTYGTKTEFIVLNRDKPSSSVNINRLLSLNPEKVTLNDKKSDRWYLYFKQGGQLKRADKNKKVEDVLNGVLSYETFGSDIVLYSKSTDSGKNSLVSILDGQDDYPIKTIPGKSVKVNLSKYNEKWYVVIGSQAEKRTYVYKNPVDLVKDQQSGMAIAPVSILKASGAINDIEFSATAQFVMSRSGKEISVYNVYDDEKYVFSLPNKLDLNSEIRWIDGDRILFRNAGKATIIDFDGLNQRELVADMTGNSAFFDRDYKVLYTISQTESDKRLDGLNVTHLLIEQDR